MTVVMNHRNEGSVFSKDASMGPRPDDRGYAKQPGFFAKLWAASMGPRPDDRGYGQAHGGQGREHNGFNGSTA